MGRELWDPLCPPCWETKPLPAFVPTRPFTHLVGKTRHLQCQLQTRREGNEQNRWMGSELGFFKEKTFSTILNFQESCKHSTRNSHIAFTPIGLSFTFYPIYLSTPPPHRFSRLLHFTVNSPGYLIKLKPVLSPLIAPITNHTYLFADFSSCFPPARMSAPRRQPCHCHTPTTVRAHEINA